jgi:nucleoside-diphosphate-sugar epimerase
MKEIALKSALVTGAGGFIGGFLCQKLIEEGISVTALAMPEENIEHLAKMGCHIVRGDLTKPDSIRGICKGIDIVYHLAARVTYWGTRKMFYDAIYEATKNILQEASGKNIRFVFASSVVAIGLGKNHLNNYREKDPTSKTGIFYGDAKLDAEKLVWQYQGDGKITGVVIRPTNVIGPGSVWVRDAVDNLKKPFFPLIDGGKWSASLLYVENLVDVFFLAGVKDAAKGQTYHVMDDYKVTWRQYFSDIADMMRKPVTGSTFLSIPFGVAWQMAGLVGGICSIAGLKTTLTRHNVSMMGRNNDLDTSKAQKELGWKTRISYDEAKKRIKEWMKQAEMIKG